MKLKTSGAIIIRVNIKKTPKFSSEAMNFWIVSGANAYSNLEPSNGGIGIILKTKRPMLTIINKTNI